MELFGCNQTKSSMLDSIILIYLICTFVPLCVCVFFGGPHHGGSGPFVKKKPFQFQVYGMKGSTALANLRESLTVLLAPFQFSAHFLARDSRCVLNCFKKNMVQPMPECMI